MPPNHPDDRGALASSAKAHSVAAAAGNGVTRVQRTRGKGAGQRWSEDDLVFNLSHQAPMTSQRVHAEQWQFFKTTEPDDAVTYKSTLREHMLPAEPASAVASDLRSARERLDGPDERALHARSAPRFGSLPERVKGM